MKNQLNRVDDSLSNVAILKFSYMRVCDKKNYDTECVCNPYR